MKIRVILMILSCCSVNVALAVKECKVHGNSINLDNGKSTEQLTGTVQCFDGYTKELIREIPYVNGKIEGVERMRLHDGNWSEQTYKADKRHGPGRTLSVEGKLLSDVQYADDRESGIAHYYHPNGKIKTRIVKAAKDKDTLGFSYDQDGRLSEMNCGTQSTIPIGVVGCAYEARSEVLKTYYEDGKTKEVLPLKNGLREGRCELYWPTGQLAQAQYYAAGVLRRMERHSKTGELHERIEYAADDQGRERKEGVEERFFEGGKPKERIVWKNFKKISEEQRWQNGQLRRRLTSEGENAEIEETYFDNGKIEKTGKYIARTNRWGNRLMQPEGTIKRYYENGQLASEINYAQGNQEGVAKRYYENGQLASHEEHKAGRIFKRKTYSKDGKLEKDEAYHEDGSRIRGN